jgi:hypothetical protein
MKHVIASGVVTNRAINHEITSVGSGNIFSVVCILMNKIHDSISM